MIRRVSYVYVFVILALLFTLAGQIQPASAQQNPAPMYRTIPVTTTKDDITKNGNCTLREAVQAANTNKTVDKCPAGSSSSTDVIKLGKGTYVISIPGRNEHANKKGDIDIIQSVKIVGAGRSYTIIDGRKIDRVFENRSTKATVTIQDLTIKNGAAIPKDESTLDEGGGIANQGNLYLTRVRLYNNSVSGEGNDSVQGGAVVNKGTLTVYDSIFEKNNAGFGGAIGNGGKLKIDKSLFKGNFAYMAGAIFSEHTGTTVDITNSRFEANEHGPGNAAVMTQFAGSTTNIRNSTFEKNNGNELISNEGKMTVRYSTFKNNSITKIFSGIKGNLTLTHSTVRNNTGGEVSLEGGILVLDRMTFDDNGGGALIMTGGEARLHNSTITNLQTEGNSSFIIEGGKLAIDMVTVADTSTFNDPVLRVEGGTVTIHNTILANTRRSSVGEFVADCLIKGGTLTSLGYNLISRTDGCGLTAATGDQFGTLDEPIDPMLGVLKNNGGYNETRGLLPGSPAIDKADPVNFFKTDQRVYKRPAGPRADIGAYERGAVK